MHTQDEHLDLLNELPVHTTTTPTTNKPRRIPTRYLLTTLLLLPLGFTLYYPLSQPPSPRHTSCGNTPTETRARNCRFDILSFAWQTPECYDAELMSDFIAYPDSAWLFYRDDNSTSDVVSLEQALQGDESLWVDWYYHIVHCTFIWRQMHRAYEVRGWIDSHLDSYRHTLHCQKTLLDRDTDMGRVNVAAVVKYPTCRRVL
ncbi:hypothetical protein OQA88_9512 [Cercophora sp. LCS_1]